MNPSRHLKFLLPAVMITLLLGGCAELLELLQKTDIKKPMVELGDARLTGLSFDKADLLFKINITNPNAVGINLSGFDYALSLNQNNFLNGKNSDALQINANDNSTIDFPVSLGFKQIFDTFQNLKNADTIAYKLDLNLGFDLPVLGVTPIPLSTSGNLPSVKLPEIGLHSLKLEKVGLTGANLLLRLNVDNPNGWSLDLQKLNYSLDINDRKWITGTSANAMSIQKHGNSVIDIPFNLNFLDMGRSVYDLVSGNQSLSYKLGGNADLKSSIPLLGQFDLPFNKSGSINLTK